MITAAATGELLSRLRGATKLGPYPTLVLYGLRMASLCLEKLRHLVVLLFLPPHMVAMVIFRKQVVSTMTLIKFVEASRKPVEVSRGERARMSAHPGPNFTVNPWTKAAHVAKLEAFAAATASNDTFGSN